MQAQHVIPTDGMIITEDTTFAPGIYALPNGITIGADNVTLTGSGTVLAGQNKTNVGIHAEGRKDIAIKNLKVESYYHGIRMDRCETVTLENVTVRDTYEIEGFDTFLYLWNPLEEAYGAAVLFNSVKGGAIRGCDFQHQMNGMLLYGTSGLTIEDNNASFNSGWGIYLSASCDNIVRENHFDFCNRLFRRPETGQFRVEADAAGIVLVYSSSRNQFVRNCCLSGGDGIFVAGYDHKGNQGPCNDNLFEENDCRYSTNNAIESTFSKGNVFRGNDCSFSNYGFWMGYSWDNVMEGNKIVSNHMMGIAIEHGHDFVIRGNDIQLNREGIRLWTRGGPVVAHWPGHKVSYNFTIEGNNIEGNWLGFNGYTGEDVTEGECHSFHLSGNAIKNNRVGARFERVNACSVSGNEITGNLEHALVIADNADVTVAGNEI